MRHHNFIPTRLTRFICLVLTYTLVISSGSLVVRRVRAASSPQATRNTPHRAKKGGKRDRELLVRFRWTASEDEINSIITSNGAFRGNRLHGRSRIERIHLSAGQDPEAVASALKADPSVELVEPNYLINKDDMAPNDPQFSAQWGLHNTGGNGGAAGSDINVTPAWDKTTGSTHAVIAVIDSGIDFSHPDLKNNEWTNYGETENGVDDDSDGLIDDLHGWDWVTGLNEIKDVEGHGTAVAGIIAAQGNNGLGISGVMWQASLMSLRVLDETGSGSISDAVEAIDYAVAHGARIINCSWGTDQPSQALYDAIVRAGRQGALVVASAGNNANSIDDTPYYPASYRLPNLIAVTATDHLDNLPSWASWGPTRVAVAAPGVDVLTTRIGGGYGSVSGTSAAVPFVSGVAGLVYSYLPGIQGGLIYAAIVKGARAVSGLDGKVSSSGVVNAEGALESATTMAPNLLPGGNSSPAGGGVTGTGTGTGDGSQSGSGSGQTTPTGPVGSGEGDPTLPNLDAARTAPATDPHVPGRIHANCIIEMDGTCDDGGGGGGGGGLGDQPPVSVPGGPYTGGVSQTVSFNGSNSYDPDGTVVSYSWNFGDGTSSSAMNPTHAYSSAGVFTVTLMVVDDGGLSNSASTTATIGGPIANTGGPYSGYTFQSIQFNGSGSTDQVGTITSYSWNFGDGNTGTGATPTHTYSVSSTYTVSLTITDNGGRTNTATTTATISTLTNRPPVSDPGGIYSTNAGSSITFNGSASYDPDGTIASYSWNFGDGTTGSGATPTHTYSSATSYTVSLTVTDNSGASSTATTEAYITNGTNIYTQFFDPANRVGGGEDLFSGNFGFSVPVLGLPGRAGMSVALGLSYNSLVWTKEGNAIGFNLDQGFPGPGFHMGMPTIQAGYDTRLSAATYMMVSPSGARTEFRQIGNTNVYETADSSYTQLTVNSSTQLTMRSTDGTSMVFAQTSLAPLVYKCTTVTDRNGNYITATYNSLGNIATITDTLGRVINFNYDATSHNLTTITQTWAGTSHIWANFFYNSLTIQTNYPGLTLVGASNGQMISVLTQVGFADGTSYTFNYNSYGQVYRFNHIAPDGHTLAYSYYNLPLNSSVAQSDCPRFTQRNDFAENWNMRVGGAPTGAYDFSTQGIAAEAITTFTLGTAATWTKIDGTSDSGTVSTVTAPDGTVAKVYFHSTGWDKGLLRLNEAWGTFTSAQTRSFTEWTQDNTGLAYILNPRIIQTDVVDSNVNNRSRSTITYAAYTVPLGASVNLPTDGYTYTYDGSSYHVYSHSQTVYNLTQPYLNLRIIGLASAKYTYDAGGVMATHVEFTYDDGDSFVVTQTGATMHDDTNFGAGYIQGRGNLTRTKAFDVTGTLATVINQIKYNVTGTVASTIDPAGHQASVDYTDQFSIPNPDNPTSHTYTYPTTVTDADGFSASSTYNYDFGAVTKTQDPKGAQTEMIYDSVGRLSQKTLDNVIGANSTYVRYAYPDTNSATQDMLRTYTLMPTPSGSQELFSAQIIDGAGRVRATQSEFPNSGGLSLYRTAKTNYDVMGRAIQTSNPIVVDGTWTPAGDDVPVTSGGTGYGWLFMKTTYDWAGRVIGTTNTDNTTTSASYTGNLGINAVVVSTDVMGRQQRVTSDSFGRAFKSEVLNQDGTTYRSTLTDYNSFGQAIDTRVFDGSPTTDRSCPTGTCQISSSTYDGFGHVITTKDPIATNSRSVTYNADDTVHTLTDPRGVTSTFTYNNRGKVTGVHFSHVAGIPDTTDISYGYDADGNRTSMTDGTGTHTYQYDTWSRLTSETQTFNKIANKSFTLSYTYTLGGQVASISDPFNETVSYQYDKAGQLTEVDGSGTGTGTYMNVPTGPIASNFQYRAWGTLKSVQYAYADSNGVHPTLSTTFDQRMRLTNFNFYAKSNTYQYNAASQLTTMGDRTYTYDYFGRLLTASTNNPVTVMTCDPQNPQTGKEFVENFNYSAFDDMTLRHNIFWGDTSDGEKTYNRTFVNGRDQNTTAFTYDEAGNELKDTEGTHTYDAAGNQVSGSYNFGTVTQSYDGDGNVVDHFDNTINEVFYLRSSALGQVVCWISPDGTRRQTHVYAGGMQIMDSGAWVIQDPVTGAVTHEAYSAGFWKDLDFDPMGQELGNMDVFQICINDPTNPPPDPDFTDINPPNKPLFAEGGDLFYGDTGCSADGMSMDCNHFREMVREGEIGEDHPFPEWGHVDKPKPYKYVRNQSGQALTPTEGTLLMPTSGFGLFGWGGEAEEPQHGPSAYKDLWALEILTDSDINGYPAGYAVSRGDGANIPALAQQLLAEGGVDDNTVAQNNVQNWIRAENNIGGGDGQISERSSYDYGFALEITGVVFAIKYWAFQLDHPDFSQTNLANILGLNPNAPPERPEVSTETEIKGINWNWKSWKTWGHTFSDHGQGPKVTRSLIGRAGGTGTPQGQWLNNEKAAELLKQYVGITEATTIEIPEGLGQVIKADGTIVPTTKALIVPRVGGVFKSAYPILP